MFFSVLSRMLNGPYIAILVAFLLLLLIRVSIARRQEGFVADDENEGITASSMFNVSEDELSLARPPPGTMDLLSPPPVEFKPAKQELDKSDTQSALTMAADMPRAGPVLESTGAGTTSTDSPQCAQWKKAKAAASLAMGLGGDAIGNNSGIADMMKSMMNSPAPPGCT